MSSTCDIVRLKNFNSISLTPFCNLDLEMSAVVLPLGLRASVRYCMGKCGWKT